MASLRQTGSLLSEEARPKVRRWLMIVAARFTWIWISSRLPMREGWFVTGRKSSITLLASREMLLRGLLSSCAIPVVSSPMLANFAAWTNWACFSTN